MAHLDHEAETEALLVDYKPMADSSGAGYNSRGTASSREGFLGNRSQNGSTQSDDELLDVIIPAELENTSGFANKDMDSDKYHSKFFPPFVSFFPHLSR